MEVPDALSGVTAAAGVGKVQLQCWAHQDAHSSTGTWLLWVGGRLTTAGHRPALSTDQAQQPGLLPHQDHTLLSNAASEILSLM